MNYYERMTSQETVEVQLLERELRENDLITSGSFLEDAKNVLKNCGVLFEVQKYTSGKIVDSKNETRIPAEYVLVIKDKRNPNENANFETTQQAFQFLKNAGVVVRYAKPRGDGGDGPEDENQTSQAV